MSRVFKNCFITGVTGSGGSYLAENIFLKDKRIKISGSYRSKGYYKLLKKNIKNIRLYRLDLRKYNSIYRLLKKVKPDVIFHFASNADVRGSFDKPISFVENNNSITINLLEAARRLNLKSIIIICSSSEVYGDVSKKDIPLREDQKFNPVNPYAATKAFQDFISQIYYKCFKLNIIITRMFSYTNARRKNLFQTAFANQIIKIKNKKQKILSHGNLDSIRTFIDINDAMDAYWLAATKGRIGEIYNIGGDKIISVRNFLKKLCSIAKLKIKSRLNKELLRPKDVTLQITDSKKFRKHTGWRPKVKFEDSVKNLLSSCEQLQKQKY